MHAKPSASGGDRCDAGDGSDVASDFSFGAPPSDDADVERLGVTFGCGSEAGSDLSFGAAPSDIEDGSGA